MRLSENKNKIKQNNMNTIISAARLAGRNTYRSSAHGSNTAVTRAQMMQRRMIHKNPYIEEWNGLREDTHKTFEITT